MTKKGFWSWLLTDSKQQIEDWIKENKKDLISTRIVFEAGAGIVILVLGIIIGFFSMFPTSTYTGPRTPNVPLLLIACGSLLIAHGKYVDIRRFWREEQ